MAAPNVVLYFDYKSPFAFLAKDLAYQLAGLAGIVVQD